MMATAVDTLLRAFFMAYVLTIIKGYLVKLSSTLRPPAASMSSSSSRHQPGSSLSCDVSSSSGGPPSQSSPSLPSKVYDCSGRVVLLQEMLQAGVTEIRGGDGRLAYCFFQVLQTYR